MSSMYDWSLIAANNASSDSSINWTEGQLPGTVNGSAKAMMTRDAELLGDIGGALTAGGTADALTVTANSAFTAYANGLILALRIATDNTTAATLNVNGIGAKSIRKMVAAGESALTGAELQATGIYLLMYSTALNAAAGGWLLLNPTIDAVTLTGTQTLTNKTLTSPTINGGTITGIADLAVADGGTGASTAADARTNLGLVIGTNVQAADATLTSLAAVAGIAGDVLYANGTDAWTRLAKGTAAQTLRMNAGATAPEWGGGNGVPDAILEDQKTSGTDGGLFTAGAWQTRTLNTEVYDTSSLITIAANQFTPTVAGRVEWECPAFDVSRHQTRLFNVTDTVAVQSGTSEFSGTATQTVSSGGGAVVAGKAYRIEHQCQVGDAIGFGVASGFGTEVYTRVKFWRS